MRYIMQQLKRKVKADVKQIDKQLGWDDAIREAEQRLETVSLLATKLRVAIRNFRHLKESGMPFPVEAGEHTATQN